MLDPLTALYVVGNVLQFIDFAGKVITASSELHGSRCGTLGINEILENAALTMIKISKKLQSLDQTTRRLSKDDRALAELCKTC